MHKQIVLVCSVLGVSERANIVVVAVALAEVDADAAIDALLVGSIVFDMDRLALKPSGLLVEHDIGLLSEEHGADIGHVCGQDSYISCLAELNLLAEFVVVGIEARIAVALVVERGTAGFGLSGGLGLRGVEQDDAIGEIRVHQSCLLVAGAVGLEEERADTVPVLDQALAVAMVDHALTDTLRADVHGDIGAALERGKRVPAEDDRTVNE